MRKIFKRYIPHPDSVRKNRFMALMGDALLHPNLWHLNRRSAAGGVAVGLFCGLIPGPFQMIGSVIACLVMRVNLPVALLATFYTNPLTIVPIYVVAYGIGGFILGSEERFIAPPEQAEMGMGEWISALVHWLFGLGEPLALGLIVLASAFAAAGYFTISLLWRWHLVRELRKRKHARLMRGA